MAEQTPEMGTGVRRLGVALCRGCPTRLLRRRVETEQALGFPFWSPSNSLHVVPGQVQVFDTGASAKPQVHHVHVSTCSLAMPRYIYA